MNSFKYLNNKLDKDILKEVINIGLAKAADKLALIVEGKVFLTVPELLIKSPYLAVKELIENKLIITEILVNGNLSGKVYIGIPENKIKELEVIIYNIEPDQNMNFFKKPYEWICYTLSAAIFNEIEKFLNINYMELSFALKFYSETNSRKELINSMLPRTSDIDIVQIKANIMNESLPVNLEVNILFDTTDLEMITPHLFELANQIL